MSEEITSFENIDREVSQGLRPEGSLDAKQFTQAEVTTIEKKASEESERRRTLDTLFRGVCKTRNYYKKFKSEGEVWFWLKEHTKAFREMVIKI